MGLADRVVPPGQARSAAEALAHEIAALPQQCLRSDRASTLEGGWLGEDEAMANEFRHGMTVLAAPGMSYGVDRFRVGAGAAPVGVQIPAAGRGDDIARAPLLAWLVPVAPAVRFRAPHRPVPHAA